MEPQEQTQYKQTRESNIRRAVNNAFNSDVYNDSGEHAITSVVSNLIDSKRYQHIPVIIDLSLEQTIQNFSKLIDTTTYEDGPYFILRNFDLFVANHSADVITLLCLKISALKDHIGTDWGIGIMFTYSEAYPKNLENSVVIKASKAIPALAALLDKRDLGDIVI